VVCSNARNHRYDADVPLLIPEVNPEHLGLIELQKRNRGWSGYITTNPIAAPHTWSRRCIRCTCALA
jgi:aspartate-semialdehyde dehydrogenase